MSTLANLVLVFLGIVVAIQLANGHAGAWLKAKLMNKPAAPAVKS
jgi:hypothetical protein